MLQQHIMNNMTDDELIRYVNRDNAEVEELCRRIETMLDTLERLKGCAIWKDDDEPDILPARPDSITQAA